jgi:hypothetical protein
MGVNKGVNIPLGVEFHPWGPGVKLRMALCLLLHSSKQYLESVRILRDVSVNQVKHLFSLKLIPLNT